MAEPGWYPDPAGRYHFRYFDGITWSRNVSLNGVAGEDPVPVDQPSESQWTYCRACGAVCRYDDDHCWCCVSSFPESRMFGAPPTPNPTMPIQQQFEAARRAMVRSFEAASMAAEQGRHKDAVRGYDEALWHRHFVEKLMRNLPKGGTTAGLAVSFLTLGFGPTDLLVGPLVRSFVNRRQQASRDRSAANDRLMIQASALLALANAPELLAAPGAEHEALVRLAFAYQPPGGTPPVDHSMADHLLMSLIASQVARMQREFSDVNLLLCDFVIFFQWMSLGGTLLQLGYPIGHLMTGTRPRDSHDASDADDRLGGRPSRGEALRVLGLTETASDEDIRRAYRELSKRHHPDRHAASSDRERSDAEEMMRKVNAAYDALT